MLKIIVGGIEEYDDESNLFSIVGGEELELEHSLVSLSKWESKYEKPFLGKEEKSNDEIVDYVRFITLTPNVSEELYSKLSKENFDDISEYIDSKMTATWFNEPPGAPNVKIVITSELIYYWMIAFAIPFECQYWHLNRLFTLIRVCNAKQEKPEQMSRSEVVARNRELNAQRRAQLGTKG